MLLHCVEGIEIIDGGEVNDEVFKNNLRYFLQGSQVTGTKYFVSQLLF